MSIPKPDEGSKKKKKGKVCGLSGTISLHFGNMHCSPAHIRMPLQSPLNNGVRTRFPKRVHSYCLLPHYGKQDPGTKSYRGSPQGWYFANGQARSCSSLACGPMLLDLGYRSFVSGSSDKETVSLSETVGTIQSISTPGSYDGRSYMRAGRIRTWESCFQDQGISLLSVRGELVPWGGVLF